ncbi:MAG: hypothetical protein JJ896_15280 [Rhodothermales bacterium]|nr:hypothetical protein [Rhodothermales bacterium]MBO6781016.1 hypothetical protein [Rhodothermales bacterium]
MEEGQLAFSASKPHSSGGPARQYADLSQYFPDGGSGFLAMLPAAFPWVDEEDRYLVQEFDHIREVYTPGLRGVEAIGVLPAPRRISDDNREYVLESILRHLKSPSVVKFHPGFSHYPDLESWFRSRLDEETKGRVQRCDDSIVLEAEMLFERKRLYGPRSSLQRYAEFFGSQYELVTQTK